MDARANTAAVYGAFLKKIKPSALKPLQLKPSALIENDNEHIIYQEDINKLIKTVSGDILYLDPPYNHRQYSSYYHILETIAKKDKPSIRGLAGIRNDDVKSLYCQKANAEKAFEYVVQNADVRYIFVSYNNEGILPLDTIREILSQRGEYGCFTQKYKRYQSDVEKNRTIHGTETMEYLHFVKVQK
jgi:adenine-specific DNA-methyltransferase